MSGNGLLVGNELVNVEPGIQLEPATARDYLRWKAYAAERKIRMSIARPAGGYRSKATQADMIANPKNYNLSSASSKTLARPGSSRHGFGRAVDIVGPSQSWVRSTMGMFGFHLWSVDDPNHYEHGTALAFSGNYVPIGDEMELDDTVRELDVSNYGVVANPAVTIRSRFEWIAWFAKRVQMQVDGQLPSILTTILAKVDGIAAPKIDQAALNGAVAAAVKDAVEAQLPAIAKAVADENYRRQAG